MVGMEHLEQTNRNTFLEKYFQNWLYTCMERINKYANKKPL